MPNKGRARNWHQENDRRIAMAAKTQNPTVRAGVRSSRYERWIQQGQTLRQKISPELEHPDALQRLAC